MMKSGPVNGSVYEGKFIMCSGCYSMTQYTIGWATKEPKPLVIKVLANSGRYLDVEGVNTTQWRFMKKSPGILDTGVRMGRGK